MSDDPRTEATGDGVAVQADGTGTPRLDSPDPGPAAGWPFRQVVELPPVGPVAGRYEQLENIGQGGWGTVYKAWDAVVGRPVALKVLRAGAAATPDGRGRFLREAHILAALRHPHIVTIHDRGTTADGRAFLALAWMPGGSLAARKSEFVGHPEKAARLVEQVARAIHAAHGHGVCHRDLKPGNILLDENGDACVTDFGIAKLLREVGDRPAAPSADRNATDGLGTPAYMAPEQYRDGFGPVGPAADVWAIGVVLYELLTGRRPFDGPGAFDCEDAVCTKPPVRPRALDRRIPRSLEQVCLKCLARRPADRYASAAAVAEALRPRGRTRVLRLVGLAVAVAAITLVGSWYANRDPGFGPIEDELRTTGKVTLVPAVGPPRYVRSLTDFGGRVPLLDPGQPFAATFDQWLGMVELLDRNPHPTLQLDAEVYITSAAATPDAGVYFGRQTIDGTHHSLELLVEREPNRVLLTLYARRLQPGGGNVHPANARLRISRRAVLLAGSLHKEYVPMSIRYSPGEVEASAGGHVVRAAVPANGRIDVLDAPPYHVSPGGGIGIVGRDAIVTVRNVHVRSTALTP